MISLCLSLSVFLSLSLSIFLSLYLSLSFSLFLSLSFSLFLSLSLSVFLSLYLSLSFSLFLSLSFSLFLSLSFSLYLYLYLSLSLSLSLSISISISLCLSLYLSEKHTFYRFFLYVLLENKNEFRQLCERRAQTFLLEGNLTSIYFPTNVHRTHWILYRLKINYRNHTAYPTFIYYDPLVNNVTSRDLDIAELRLKILFENMPLGDGIISRAPLKGRRSVYDDLQQDDGASCGYYVLECINRMALGSPRTEFDVPAFREEVEDVLDYKIQRANKQIKDETRERMEKITNYYRAMHRLSGANSVLSE